VQEYDSAWVDSSDKFAECLLFCGLLILIPVYIGKTPEKSLISQFLRHFLLAFTVFALGWTIELGHGLSGSFCVEVFQLLKLLGEGVYGGYFRHIRMMVGVITHSVAFLDHSFHQIRAGGDEISNHKESGRGIVLFQCIQDSGCVSVFIAAVKGEVNDFLFCIFGIIGIVLFQFIEGGVCHRRFALLLETKTPVAVSGGGNRFCLPAVYRLSDKTAGKVSGGKEKSDCQKFFNWNVMQHNKSWKGCLFYHISFAAVL